jgi:hypothetical protein
VWYRHERVQRRHKVAQRLRAEHARLQCGALLCAQVIEQMTHNHAGRQRAQARRQLIRCDTKVDTAKSQRSAQPRRKQVQRKKWKVGAYRWGRNRSCTRTARSNPWPKAEGRR